MHALSASRHVMSDLVSFQGAKKKKQSRGHIISLSAAETIQTIHTLSHTLPAAHHTLKRRQRHIQQGRPEAKRVCLIVERGIIRWSLSVFLCVWMFGTIANMTLDGTRALCRRVLELLAASLVSGAASVLVAVSRRAHRSCSCPAQRALHAGAWCPPRSCTKAEITHCVPSVGIACTPDNCPLLSNYGLHNWNVYFSVLIVH